MSRILRNALSDDSGQDIAEYAVMAAVTIMVVLGILALIGVNASQIFFKLDALSATRLLQRLTSRNKPFYPRCVGVQGGDN